MMKPVSLVIGVILILFGLASLGYQSFTYKTPEKVMEIGSLVVTAETEKTVILSPIVGGGSLVLGIVLVVWGTRRGG